MLDSHYSSRKHSEDVLKPDLDEIMGRSVEATTQTSQTPTPHSSTKHPNKHLKSVQQLTESSSSGSVTDSICTAYEQNQATEEAATTAKAPEKKSTTKKDASSVITTVLGNILQFGKSRSEHTEVDSTDFEPFKYSFSDFRVVDHRLKLYLCANIFEDDELKWLVKGRIYDENTTDSDLYGLNGLVVMSTTKFYFLKAIKDER